MHHKALPTIASCKIAAISANNVENINCVKHSVILYLHSRIERVINQSSEFSSADMY